MRRRALLIVSLIAALVPAMARTATAEVPAMASLDLTAPVPGWSQDGPHTVMLSSPVVSDVNGDGRPDIVAVTHDGWVYVADLVGNGLVILPGWPVNLGNHVNSSPAVADLDGDGQQEILIGVGEALTGDMSRPGGVAALRADGTRRFFHQVPNFPETGDNGVISTPAIGDINHDGALDIVFSSYNRYLYAIDRDGNNLPGWPIQLVDTTWSSPALVDIDRNGTLEVVVGSDFGWHGTPNLGCSSPPTNGLLLVVNADGNFRPGWPKCLPTPIWSSPAIVDFGDGVPVAVFGTNNWAENHGGQDKVYAYRLTDGTAPPGWPATLRHGASEQTFSSPAVADIDGDGRPEIAIGSVYGNNPKDGSLYLIGSDGGIRWEKTYSERQVLGSPVLGDVDGDGKAEVVVGTGDWNVYAYKADGQAAYQGPSFFHSEIFIFNSPVLADLNGDGTNEMVVASGNFNDYPKMWVVPTGGKALASANPWPMFRQNPARTGTTLEAANTPIVRAAGPRYNFDEYLVLANPTASVAHATVTLQLPTGPPLEVPVEINAHSRQTVPVDAQVPNSDVSAKVDSDQPLVAERSMYFNYGAAHWTGGHATHGAAAPATDWFLAEGYTAPNFATYVLIQNPNPSPVDVVVTLMKPGGATASVPMQLQGQSRKTLDVKSVPGFENTEASFQVHGSGPLVVERSMYFDYGGRTGGHDALGVTTLAQDWFLAEGYTGGSFDTYVLVANPNDAPANVTYTFLRPNGGPVTASRTIPAHSRGTIKVDDVPGLEATDVSTKVSADVPVAVERAMYFDYYGRTGGHDAEGVTQLGTDWYLAEGYTGPGFDTYVLLANPSAEDAAVTLTLFKEDGSPTTQALTIPAQSRRTVHLNEVLPNAGMWTQVKVTNGVGISVERAMYFVYAGTWDGGHDSQAIADPSTTWYFAEGYTGP